MPLNTPKIKTIPEITAELAQKAEKFHPYNEILNEIQGDITGHLRHDLLIAYFTPNSKVIYINKKLSSILGFLPEEIVGRHAMEFVLNNDVFHNWNKPLIPALSNNDLDIVRGKQIIKTASGQPAFVDFLYFAYRDELRNLVFVKGILKDVTNDVLATDKLIAEKEKIEKILTCGQLGYWILDTSNEEIILSGNYESISEYAPNEITNVSKFFKTNVHPDDWNNSYVLTKSALLQENDGVEFRLKTKSGKYKWILSKIVRTEINKTTGHKIISGIHLDIDASKRANLRIREKERQIIKNEENLRKIYKALPIGVIIYNSGGDYVESNDELLKIFELKSKKEINKVNLLNYNGHIKSLIQNYEYSIDIAYDLHERKMYKDYTSAPKTQHTRYINIKIVSLLDTEGYVNLDNIQNNELLDTNDKHETETGYLLVATDTTILRRAELDLRLNELELKEKNIKLSNAKEKAQESDRLKSAFLANVSHEIRTPLNAIIGFSELIATSDDKEEKDIYFDIVKTNNDLLLNLINDILDLSKIESGRIELKYAPVNMDKICYELVEAAKLRVTENIKIIYKLPENILLKTENGNNYIKQTLLNTDKNRLSQIYNNLINNAIKNTRNGAITVSHNLVEINEAGEIIRNMSINEAERIELDIYDTTKVMIACSVYDTGCGIPENKIGEIFNRFTKLNDNQSGFGLGLAIIKSLVEQMGGHIIVKSKIGEGSEFTVILPYNTSKGEPECWYNIENISVEELRKSFGENNVNHLGKDNNSQFIEKNKKMNIKSSDENLAEDKNMGEKMLDILVAEDIDFNYMLVKAIIGKKYNLYRAKTGVEAVDLFDKQKFDVILMDMKMPEMDGITATRIIREKDKIIPIIAVTAYAFDTDKQIALDAGCNSYIVKPIDPKILIAEIERYA
ncbi:MAG: response regulator [Bacteroidales bacterium]